ncbi:MAG: LPXTG cell wall anchor domain-containing protein [Ferruginibacter sp.]
MKNILLDVVEENWIDSDHHLALIIAAAVSLAALIGIFIYRKRKGL